MLQGLLLQELNLRGVTRWRLEHRWLCSDPFCFPSLVSHADKLYSLFVARKWSLVLPKRKWTELLWRLSEWSIQQPSSLSRVGTSLGILKEPHSGKPRKVWTTEQLGEKELKGWWFHEKVFVVPSRRRQGNTFFQGARTLPQEKVVAQLYSKVHLAHVGISMAVTREVEGI